MGGTRRRDAKEWRRLIRAWKRSGLERAEFAAAQGVAPSALTWWRWRLERAGDRSLLRPAPASRPAGDRRRRPAAASSQAVGLVRVEVGEPAAAAALRAEWELVAPSGHTLRVRGAGTDALRAAVELLLRTGSTR